MLHVVPREDGALGTCFGDSAGHVEVLSAEDESEVSVGGCGDGFVELRVSEVGGHDGGFGGLPLGARFAKVGHFGVNELSLI